MLQSHSTCVCHWSNTDVPVTRQDRPDPSFPPLHSAAFGFSRSQVWTLSPPTCSPLPSQEPTPLLDDFMLWNSSIFSTVHQMRPLSALSFFSSYKGLWPISHPSEVFCPLSRVWEEFQHLPPTHSFCSHCPLFRISPNTSLHGAHKESKGQRVSSLSTPLWCHVVLLIWGHHADSGGKGLRLGPSEPTGTSQIQQGLNKCHRVPAHL